MIIPTDLAESREILDNIEDEIIEMVCSRPTISKTKAILDMFQAMRGEFGIKRKELRSKNVQKEND